MNRGFIFSHALSFYQPNENCLRTKWTIVLKELPIEQNILVAMNKYKNPISKKSLFSNLAAVEDNDHWV